MGRMIRCGALALAVLSLAAEASAADCWLLDPQGLEQARRNGACRDVFARDTWESAEAPRRPQQPPSDPVAAFVQGLGQDFQAFVGDLDRDFRSFGRFLSQAGTPQPVTPDR